MKTKEKKKYQKIIFKRLAFCWKVFKRENKKKNRKRMRREIREDMAMAGTVEWRIIVDFWFLISRQSRRSSCSYVMGSNYSKWSLREWLMEAIKPRVVNGKIGGHCRSIVSMRWWDVLCKLQLLLWYVCDVGVAEPIKAKTKKNAIWHEATDDDEKAHVTGS